MKLSINANEWPKGMLNSEKNRNQSANQNKL